MLLGGKLPNSAIQLGLDFKLKFTDLIFLVDQVLLATLMLTTTMRMRGLAI